VGHARQSLFKLAALQSKETSFEKKTGYETESRCCFSQANVDFLSPLM